MVEIAAQKTWIFYGSAEALLVKKFPVSSVTVERDEDGHTLSVSFVGAVADLTAEIQRGLLTPEKEFRAVHTRGVYFMWGGAGAPSLVVAGDSFTWTAPKRSA